MKKFFLIVLFLFFALVGGLGFFIIRSFNTDTFQKQIIQNITDMTGREFQVMGSTYVTWFPTPQIVMNDITLANTKGAQRAVMLRANKIMVELEWPSLLKSPLVIKKIDVENPTLFLERTDATHVNWDFPFLFTDMVELDDMSTADDQTKTRVDALVIQGGTIEYDNAIDKKKSSVKNINGNLNIETLQGPYTFNGTFTAKDKTMTAQLKIMQLANDSPVPFSLNLIGEDNNFTFEFNGKLVPSTQKTLQVTSDGSFSVKQPNEFLPLFGLKPLSKELNVPSLGNITYESANGINSFKSFSIRFGENEDSVALTGSLERDKNEINTYKVTLAINKLDYSQWANFLDDLNWNNLTNTNTPNFNLKVNAQTFIYDKINAQNLTMDFSKQANRFHIQNGKVTLDGKTNITFDGESVTQDEKTGVEILFAGQTDELHTLLQPLIDTKAIQSHLLKKANFKGSIKAEPKKVHLDLQEFLLNKTKVNGTIDYAFEKEKPTIQTKLNWENVDFDEYFGWKRTETKTNITQLLPLIKKEVQELTFLQKFNGSFDWKMKNVKFRNVPIESLSFDGKVDNGNLKISQFNIKQLANANISGDVDITSAGTENAVLVNATVDFVTPQMSLFLDKTNLMTDEQNIQNLKDFSIKSTISENKNSWTINAQTTIDELDFKLSGNIKTGEGDPVYQDLSVDLSYPDFKHFTKNIIDVRASNTALAGDFNIKMVLNGTSKDVKITNGSTKIGPHNFKMSGSYKRTMPPELVLNIETPSLNVNQYMWNEFKNIQWRGINAQKPFKLDLFDNAHHSIRITTPQLLFHDYELKNAILDVVAKGHEKTFILKELSGSIGDTLNPFKATGTLTWEDTPTVSLTITGSDINVGNNLLSRKDMSFGEGTSIVNIELKGKGDTPQKMLSQLNGKGHLTLLNNVWVGTSIDKITPLIKRALSNRVPKNIFDKEMNRILNSGKTTINKIDADFTIDNGKLKAMNAELTGDGFTSNPMLIEWDIPQNSYDISIPLTLEAYADLPPFALTVKGPKKSLAFQTNYVDLSSSVADLVNQDNSRIAKIEQAEKDKEEASARNEREEKIREAILGARTAVSQATEKVNTGDNLKALYLLRNAQDALDFVNTLSVKETLTDGEYMQLTEQSRLAILKAEEAVAEATNDKFFEDRKKLHAFKNSSKEMQNEIDRIQKTHPDIEIVQKLSPATAKYTNLLKELADTAHAGETDEEHRVQMYTARAAYTKVVKGYQYVLRFDTDAKEIKPLSLAVPENTAPEMFVKETQKKATNTSNKPTIRGVINQALPKDDDELPQTWQESELSRPAEGRERIRQRIQRVSVNDEKTDVKEFKMPDTRYADETEIDTLQNLPEKGSSLRGSISRIE